MRPLLFMPALASLLAADHLGRACGPGPFEEGPAPAGQVARIEVAAHHRLDHLIARRLVELLGETHFSAAHDHDLARDRLAALQEGPGSGRGAVAQVGVTRAYAALP